MVNSFCVGLKGKKQTASRTNFMHFYSPNYKLRLSHVATTKNCLICNIKSYNLVFLSVCVLCVLCAVAATNFVTSNQALATSPSDFKHDYWYSVTVLWFHIFYSNPGLRFVMRRLRAFACGPGRRSISVVLGPVTLVRHWARCTFSEGPRLRKIKPPSIELRDA